MITPPSWRNRFIRLIGSPHFHIVTGVLLALTAGIEIVEEFHTLFTEKSNIGAEHGMFLFALVQILHKVAELMEGSVAVGKGEQHLVERP